jgi:hypothetical protein
MASDKKRDSPAYWEARLKRMGLCMNAGYNPNWLSYGHSVTELDTDGRKTFTVDESRESKGLSEWSSQ